MNLARRASHPVGRIDHPSGRSPRRRALLAAAAAALLVALLGGLATDIGPWYASLKKPAWQPPDSWFGPAWTLIYACCALSAAAAWPAARSASDRANLLLAWSFNACLNVGWSLLFFRLQRPDWALMEVVLLWSSIGLLIVVSARRSRRAALLLLPYLAWVSFAAVLNLAVVQLNPR
jgi:tryptophan-rich sensory protein